MNKNITAELHNVLKESLLCIWKDGEDLPNIEIEKPANKEHGDFSSNLALKVTRSLKRKPMDIANALVLFIHKILKDKKLEKTIVKVEVKCPGFINFYVSIEKTYSILYDIFENKENYGRSMIGNKEKVQVEFVSANPTGPLSVAHARQAAVGDALVNILNFIGFDSHKEYYVNDRGNQIYILGESIRGRALQRLGLDVDFPDDYYQGEYIKDMAQIFIKEKSLCCVKDVQELDSQYYMNFGSTFLLERIKKDLEDFRVVFDVWRYESKVATQDNIDDLLNDFDKKGLTYEKDGALWFRSTEFGDDKDRVLRKSDGKYTYLTPDIVYHKDKFIRGFHRVFDILGPDHHGYINRIKAAVQGLGKKKESLDVLIVQLASIYRNGKEVSMSTRKGQFISLREVIDEVGVDTARFFFLMRHIKMHLDFDLELAKKQSSENPVFYIQYAYARIQSIYRKSTDCDIEAKYEDLSFLTAEEEIDLIKGCGEFGDVLILCYKQLDPYPLVSYLQDLAACFHKFYDKQRIIDEKKEIASERLALVNATGVILANGLKLLGISLPDKM